MINAVFRKRDNSMRYKLYVMMLVPVIILGLALAPPAGAAEPLRLGILPIVDALPLLVAEELKLYEQYGAAVEVINFSSAMERDSAFQAGRIDGGISDILTVTLQHLRGQPVAIASVVLGATAQEGVFSILAAPNSGLEHPGDLKGVPIAISTNTIIEYVTDRLLTNAGLAPAEISKVNIRKIPLRLQMLLEGKVQAATLPEPLATLARRQGARLIIDDTGANLSQSVLLLDREVLARRGAELKRFALAYNRAVLEINADPNRWRDLLVRRARLPKTLATDYTVDFFPHLQLPCRDQIEAVARWLEAKGMTQGEPDYAMLLDETLVSR